MDIKDRPVTYFFRIFSAGAKKSPSFESIGVSDSGVTEIILRNSGRPWTDCLTPTCSHLPMVLSERSVMAIHGAKLRGMSIIPVMVKNSKGKLAPHLYFIVMPKGDPLKLQYEGYVKVDNMYKLVFVTDDPNDDRYSSGPPDDYIYPRPIPVSTPGKTDDFLKAKSAFSTTLVFGGFYVTRRVVELARAERWTNIDFTPVDCLTGVGGDYLSRPWPPESWYAQGHP